MLDGGDGGVTARLLRMLSVCNCMSKTIPRTTGC